MRQARPLSACIRTGAIRRDDETTFLGCFDKSVREKGLGELMSPSRPDFCGPHYFRVFCFHAVCIRVQKVNLRIDVGEMQVDYAEIAQKEHLDSLSIEVRKLKDKLKDIHNQQEYQRVSRV